MGYCSSITERKLIENKLRKSEENLKRAQRVAHIGNWEMEYNHRKNYMV